MSHAAHQLGLDLARLMRPQNTRFSILFFLLPQLSRDFHWSQMLSGSALIMVLYGISTAYNDFRDLAIDRTNKRDLPLVRRALSLRHINGLLIVLVVLSLALNIVLPQPATVFFTLTYVALAVAYSAPYTQLSYRGLAGTVVLGWCYLGLPLGLGLAYSGRPSTPALLAVCVLLAAPVLLYKDFKDQMGDRAHGKYTPVVSYGEIRTKQLTFVLYTAGILLFAVGIDFSLSVGILGIAAFLFLFWASSIPARRHYALLAYMISVSLLFGMYLWQ
jgi:4-hydroxybenzoate polyprenyltransferase